MSRLRSSRGSSPAARTARPAAAASRRPGVLVQAPKSDIFVAMLGVALGAILLACLLMLLILWRYDFKVNAKLAAQGFRCSKPDHRGRDPRSLRLRGSAPDLVAITPPSVRPARHFPGTNGRGFFLLAAGHGRRTGPEP